MKQTRDSVQFGMLSYIIYLRIESMKKYFMAAAICCLITLSACGESGKTAVEPDGKLDPCTLRFSWWGGDDRHEATLKAIELWNKKIPKSR